MKNFIYFVNKIGLGKNISVSKLIKSVCEEIQEEIWYFKIEQKSIIPKFQLLKFNFQYEYFLAE